MPDQILITTDDLEHAVRANAALEASGYDTVLATSLDEVRQAFRRREPDCLVVTGGLHEESAAVLLGGARDRAISTLGLVEATDPDPKGVARTVGLTAYLVKPPDPAEVVATVRRLIDAGPHNSAWGVPATLAALHQHRVRTLIVDDAFSQPGVRCRTCGCLAGAHIGSCESCGGVEIELIEDVVEFALERALEQGSALELLRSSARRSVRRSGVVFGRR